MKRYEIKNTDSGPNFYDAEEDRDLTLTDVLTLLNDGETMSEFLGRRSAEKVALETANNALCSDLEELDETLTSVRNALTRAGVGDWEPYPDNTPSCGRMRSVAERIDILARRSRPHEDPARTAYVVGLERAAQSVLSSIDDVKSALAGATEFALALEQLRQATEGTDPRDCCQHKHDDPKEPKTVPGKTGVDIELGRWREWARRLTDLDSTDDAALRRAADVKMARDREELMATIRHQRHKLTRVAELVPPYAEVVDGRKIMAAVMEQLPPSDPLAVEITRQTMLQEIDDVLQKAGCWRGSRLDSVVDLVTRHNGMRTCLKLVLEWIERDGPAIRSRVEED